MKRIGFLLLLGIVSVMPVMGQSFPSGEKFYFGRNDGRLMSVTLMYDNMGDAVATVLLGYASHLFVCTGSSDEWFSFEGYTLAPEYKAQSVGLGGFPVMMPTGNVCKSKNEKRFFLARDCSQAVYNDTWYTIRLSEARFHELYDQNYGNSPEAGGGGGSYDGGSANSGSYDNSGSSGDTSRHGYTTCKSCGGTGLCRACHGNGHFVGRDGDVYPCLSCNRSGQCGVCHGQKRIRY